MFPFFYLSANTHIFIIKVSISSFFFIVHKSTIVSDILVKGKRVPFLIVTIKGKMLLGITFNIFYLKILLKFLVRIITVEII